MYNKKYLIGFLLFICCIFISYNSYSTSLVLPEPNSFCLPNPVVFEWQNNNASNVEAYKLVVRYAPSSVNSFTSYLEEYFDNSTFTATYSFRSACLYEWKIVTIYTVSSGKVPDTTESRLFTSILPEIKFKLLTESGNTCAEETNLVNNVLYGDIRLNWDYDDIDSTGILKLAVLAKDMSTNEVDTTNFDLNDKTGIINIKCDVHYIIDIYIYSDVDKKCIFLYKDPIDITLLENPNPPEYSNLSIPSGANCVTLNPILKWRSLDSTIISPYKYFVYIYNSELEGIDTLESNTDSIQVLLSDYNTTYYWSVCALNKLTGCMSLPSETRSFTTLISPVDLLIPANDAIGAETIKENTNNVIQFTWQETNPNIKFNNYIIQISTSKNFDDNSIVLIDTLNVCSFDFTLDSTMMNKELLWRVKTFIMDENTNYYCESNWSSIRILKTPYNTPTIIYPSSSICVNKQDPFKWNSVPDALGYEIYLTKDSTFLDTNLLNKIVIDTNVDSLYIDVDLESETVYYWKIRAIDTLNNSLFSDVAEFKTAIPSPTLMSPVNNAVDVNTPVLFTWSNYEDVSYNFQLSLEEDFATFVMDTVLVDQNTILLELPANSNTYYWRVSVTRVEDDLVCTSSFSDVFSFIVILASPVLLTPENMDEIADNEVDLTWEEVENATEYELQLTTDPTFTTNVETINKIFDNQYNKHSLLELQTYYWRVRAINKDKNVKSEWSDTFSFITGINRPGVPKLLRPNIPNKIPVLPTFVWNKAIYAKSYVLEYATDLYFKENLVVIRDIMDTNYTLTEPLNNYTLYYWRVHAVNDSVVDNKNYKVNGSYSEVWSFRTIKAAPVGKVELYLPLNNTTELIWDEIVLSWNPLDNADYYKVQVSLTQDFSSFAINVPKVEDTEYSTLRYLDTNKKFYWRVCGENEAGTAEWSDVWCFSTSRLLSIYNTDVFEGINLSPNPASHNVNIDFTALRNLEATISIVNTQGIEINRINGSYLEGNNTININVTEFNSGTYICYIMSKGKIIATTQFVVIK